MNFMKMMILRKWLSMINRWDEQNIKKSRKWGSRKSFFLLSINVPSFFLFFSNNYLFLLLLMASIPFIAPSWKQLSRLMLVENFHYCWNQKFMIHKEEFYFWVLKSNRASHYFKHHGNYCWINYQILIKDYWNFFEFEISNIWMNWTYVTWQR